MTTRFLLPLVKVKVKVKLYQEQNSQTRSLLGRQLCRWNRRISRETTRIKRKNQRDGFNALASGKTALRGKRADGIFASPGRRKATTNTCASRVGRTTTWRTRTRSVTFVTQPPPLLLGIGARCSKGRICANDVTETREERVWKRAGRCSARHAVPTIRAGLGYWVKTNRKERSICATSAITGYTEEVNE